MIRGGADVDQDGPETPFLGAVKWSLFDAAEELLKHGANANWQDAKKMTALHYMLKKGSDKKHVAMVISYGARGDIPNKDGVTAAEVMMRKKGSGVSHDGREAGRDAWSPRPIDASGGAQPLTAGRRVAIQNVFAGASYSRRMRANSSTAPAFASFGANEPAVGKVSRCMRSTSVCANSGSSAQKK